MKLDILAIAAHPDDVELCCSAALIQEIEKGAKVGILDLTRGELGTRGNAELRMEEAEEAGRRMGIHMRANACLHDGFFTNEEESIRTIIPFIREYKPTIVLTNAIEDRHPDHARASKLVSDACFYSGLMKIITFDDEDNPQDRWRPSSVYYFIQDHYHRPDIVVDISNHFDKKMEAIKAFSSQFHDPDSNEPDSPISGQEFFPYLEARAREMGRWIGTTYGEGFLTQRPIQIKSFLNIEV